MSLLYCDQIDTMEVEKVTYSKGKTSMIKSITNRSWLFIPNNKANKRRNNKTNEFREGLKRALGVLVMSKTEDSNGILKHVIHCRTRYSCRSSKFRNKDGYLRSQTFNTLHQLLQVALFAFFILLIQQPNNLFPQIGCQTLNNNATSTTSNSTTIQNNRANHNATLARKKTIGIRDPLTLAGKK